MSIAFTFPGQGSQAVGMGKDLADAFPEARAVFDEVDDALGEKLSTIIWEGPEDDADADRQCPAGADGGVAGRPSGIGGARLFAERQGLLCRRPLARRIFGPGGGRHVLHRGYGAAAAHSRQCDAGRSSGRRRARWRRSSVSTRTSSKPPVSEAAHGSVCQIANDNGGGQLVISGAKAAVEQAASICTEKGAKRAIMLPVSAPFHSALMAPAAETMREALAKVTMNKPVCPVVTNVVRQADRRTGGNRRRVWSSRSPAACAGARRSSGLAPMA